MKFLKEIYIFSDVDGTIYSSKGGISKENSDAINWFVANGGHFALATGRAVKKAREIADKLPINTPCIVCNGGAAYSFKKEEYLYKCFLPENAIKYAKDILNEFPFISAVGVTEEDYFSLTGYNEKAKFHTDVVYDKYSIDNFPKNMFKILFSVPDEKSDSIFKYMKDSNFAGVEFISTDTFYIDMLPIGVNKGSGILRLAEIENFSIKNTVGVGDYYNDIDMLKTVGISCCVGNAPQDIKDICNIILPDFKENAIASLVEYFEKNYK